MKMTRFAQFTPQAIFARPLYFKNVTILGPDGPLGSALRVKGERVVEIDGPPGQKDHLVDGQGGLLIPGLINAHDHLELNAFRRLKYRETYIHSRQWVEDIEARFDRDPALVEPRQQPLLKRLWASALKNLLSGVTTVCHHNPLHRPLRWGYPIRVVKQFGFCHSLFRGDDPTVSYRQTKSNWPWIIHLAEGVDAEAAAEFEQLNRLGLVQPNTVLVHGVGLTPTQRQTLANQGGGMIWCPASNQFLFGQTAQVTDLAQVGKVALGSDSRLTGAFDLLAELHVANETGQLSPQALFQSVTSNAARLLRLSQPGSGRIVEGGMADLLLLPPATNSDPYAALGQINRQQIQLVLLAGKPLLGSPQLASLFTATKIAAISMQVDGVEKMMAKKIGQQMQKLAITEPGVVLNSVSP